MLDSISLHLLQKTRMTEKQSRVYLALLELGRATVAEVAERAELKRPLTYVIIDELVVLGYVSPVAGIKKRMYTAVDPNSIASELESTTRDFKEMLPYLRAKQRKAGKPHVTYYSGIEGVRRAFAQIRKPKEARYAISIKKALTRVPDEVARWKKLYLTGQARPGGRHLLTNTSEDRAYGEAIMQAHQVVRYLQKDRFLDMDLALVDNTVYLTAFEEDDIHVTVIESAALYVSLCTLYDLSWEAATPQ